MTKLTFGDACERKVEVEIPVAWAVLYEVSVRMAQAVHERPGWEAEMKRLACRIDEMISDDDTANNAVGMCALLAVLFAHLAAGMEVGALEVFDVGESDGGRRPMTWLN